MSETNNTQERGLRKTRIGVVVSDKMDKTVTIQIKNCASVIPCTAKS